MARAGTTLRFIFEKQTVMGEWEFPLIYGFKQDEWEALLKRFRKAVDGWKAGTREGPRVFVEVRGNWPVNWCVPNPNPLLRAPPSAPRSAHQPPRVGSHLNQPPVPESSRVPTD